jgi:acetyl-CoA acyltransferase
MTQNTPGSLQDVYVLAAVRTPIGRIGGALAAVRPDDLAATAVRNVVERLPDLDPAAIDEAYLGDANGAGEDNRNVARMAVLLAGLPVTIPGATVNRLCGSGLEAVMDGSRAVAVGDADVVLAGGVESMSRAPWVLPKPAKGYPTGHEQLWSTTLGWRMTNPLMPSEWTISLGEGAEVLADKYSISREAQDAFALASHQNAAAAWEAGWFADETVAVPGAPLERDECIRADSTLEKLAALKPVFRAGGTVTAGNASPMNDGAAGLVLASEAGAQRAGASPLARVVSRATSGVEPRCTGSVRSRRPAGRWPGPAWSGAISPPSS